MQGIELGADALAQVQKLINEPVTKETELLTNPDQVKYMKILEEVLLNGELALTEEQRSAMLIIRRDYKRRKIDMKRLTEARDEFKGENEKLQKLLKLMDSDNKHKDKKISSLMQEKQDLMTQLEVQRRTTFLGMRDSEPDALNRTTSEVPMSEANYYQ